MPSLPSLNVRQRILGSFVVVLAVMIAMAGVAHVELARVKREAASLLKDSLPGMSVGTEIRRITRSDYTLMLESLLEGSPSGVAAMDKQILADRKDLDALLADYEATIYQDQDQQNFETFKTRRDALVALQNNVVKAALEGHTAEALTMLRGQLEPVSKGALNAIHEAVKFKRASADASSIRITDAETAATESIYISLAVALLLSAVSAYYLLKVITQPLGRLTSAVEIMRAGDFTQRLQMDRRDEFGALAQGFDHMTDDIATLVGEVQKSSLRVNQSITQISAAYRDQQAAINEISATTNEVGVTSSKISATSKQLVATMNEVSQVSEDATALAGGGQAGLTRMEETMGQLMDATAAINAKLDALNAKADSINQVVATVSKVADQTNLLSFNAAIEAEKAGEYGRGFAVVATEIRRLADQTAVATDTIGRTVKEIQAAVSASVMGMDKFSDSVRRGIADVREVGRQLSEIIQRVQTLGVRFDAVNQGMQAQADGAEQISGVLMQLSDAVQQIVISLGHSDQAVEEMHYISEGLNGSVSAFRLQAAAAA